MSAEKMKAKFIAYVAEWYCGDDCCYPEFFGPNYPSNREIGKAIDLLRDNYSLFFSEGELDGDSTDREIVRDIIFSMRGKVSDLEYPIAAEVVARAEFSAQPVCAGA